MLNPFIFMNPNWIVLAVQALALLTTSVVFAVEIPMTEETVVLILTGLCIALF
jgi:hypothetical protein